MSIGTSLVYILCLATSIACAGLLARAYARTRTALLLYSSLCFALLAVNNFFVVADVFVFQQDLTLVRNLANLAAVSVLLYAFIWEVD